MKFLAKTLTSFINKTKFKYYKFRGSKTLTIGDYSVDFIVENVGDIIILRILNEYEKTVIKDVLQTVEDMKSPTVFDIGANIGVYSLFIKEAHHGAEVVAVEPHAANANRLLQNINYNDMDIDIIQCLASNTEQLMHMSGFGGEFTNSVVPDGTFAIGNRGNIGQVYVHSTTLTHIVQNGSWDTPDIIKIDVEGSEGQVLRGLVPILNDIDIIYYELHLAEKGNTIHEYNEDVDAIHGIIDNKGFARKRLVNLSKTEIWKAESQ